MSPHQKFISFSDLHKAARRRLPRILFDVIESGVEDEAGLRRNEEAFGKHILVPRVLLDVAVRSQKTSLFGQSYASPVGIAPTGLAGMFRFGAESMLARAAIEVDVPFILSGACIEAMETVASAAPGRVWYQLYAANDRAVTEDLICRAEQAGISTLVLTVDTPVLPKRERDMRNGFGLPLRPPLRLALEALTHPGWLAHHLRHGGLPVMQTWAKYLPPGATPGDVFGYFRRQSPSVQTWNDLDHFRRRWKGQLVVKGVQHPDDALRAANAGVDGIIVSNHGGKAMDRAPAAIDALPGIAAAVGHRVVVMMDSGVRRGGDVVVALCLGARFVFAGRAPLYGVIADGQRGAARSIAILADEIDRTLGLIGCADVQQLGTHFLQGAAPSAPLRAIATSPTVLAPTPGEHHDNAKNIRVA